jgi:integrase
MGSIYKRGDIFWIKYYRAGKAYYESTESPKEYEATRLLRLREGSIAEGKFMGIEATRTTINDLAKLYQKDYAVNRRKSIKEANRYADLILDYFGGMKAAHLTTAQVTDYRMGRQAEGVSDSTINRELSALRRMFHLGMKHEPPLVSRLPNIPLVKENNVRKGFFTDEEFRALSGALPDHQKVMATIAYYTGMRLGEIKGLRWDQVDFADNLLRLDPGTTKNDEGRTIPLFGEIRSALKQWRTYTESRWPGLAWICHYKGKPITEYKRAWKTALKRVGLEGRKFHDFRRTGVRNLIRAGVPEAVAMKISGHKTRSVLDRYNIVSHADLEIATEKLTRYIEEKRRTERDGYKTVTIEAESKT